MGIILAVLGAVIAVVAAGIGSTIAVGIAGQVGAGIISEEPEKFGKVLLLEALPGTQGIYGFLAAIMILQKIGLLGGGAVTLTTGQGWQILLACLPVALAGFATAIFQGRVSVAGMNVVVKQPADSGKAIILAAMVETYAVLGLLGSILLISGINIG